MSCSVLAPPDAGVRLHMPRNTPYFQAQAAAYADGELVVAAEASPELRVRDDEIVFVARETADTDGGDGDGDGDGDGAAAYRVTWLRETPDDAERPFRLSSVLLAETAVDRLPPPWLDRHLLRDVPCALGSALGTSSSSSSSVVAAASPLHVVVSTRSGVGQAQAFYDGVLAPLLGRFGLLPATAAAASPNRTYSLLVTSSSRSVSELAQTLGSKANTADTPTVILLSGDGGVVDLLNGLPERHHRPTIALLPLGTGNALFHSLHRPARAAASTSAPPSAPSPLVRGLRTLLHGRPAALPNFEATFAPGSHTVSYAGEEAVARLRGAIVASYGFHAQLVWESDTPEYRRHGAARFGMAAQELLKTAHVYAADVETTTSAAAGLQSLGHRFSYVLATMVSNLEQTFTISPASRPLDGQLRLVHFGAVGGERTMEVMMAAYNNGAHVGMRWSADEAVGYGAIDELKITVHEPDARWRKVCIDGTIVELPRDGWMRVRKATQPVLRIITDAV